MEPLVLDTSVWINILATNSSATILTAIATEVLVPAQVLAEIVRDPITGLLYASDNHPLLAMEGVSVVRLTDTEAELFLQLVSPESGSRLGDGEAAAVALASQRRIILGLDERKARRVASANFPDLILTSSAELLEGQLVRDALGDVHAQECVRRAFEIGRMHRVAK